MIHRARLGGAALQKANGIPRDALDAMAETLAAIVEDPYDALLSLPVKDDRRERWAVLGDGGFVEFRVDDAAATITVYEITWVG